MRTSLWRLSQPGSVGTEPCLGPQPCPDRALTRREPSDVLGESMDHSALLPFHNVPRPASSRKPSLNTLPLYPNHPEPLVSTDLTPRFSLRSKLKHPRGFHPTLLTHLWGGSAILLSIALQLLCWVLHAAAGQPRPLPSKYALDPTGPLGPLWVAQLLANLDM